MNSLANSRERAIESLPIDDLWRAESDFDLSAGPKKISVLIVDDSMVDYELQKRLLNKMHMFEPTIYHAQDIVSARSLVEAVDIDVALVDYCLGVESGTRAIHDIGGRCGNFAVIMVSGMPGSEIGQIALNAGAINHIDKNHMTPVNLESTIRSALYTHSIETRLKNTIVELQEVAQAKDNFFSRMSHDLKTPLNAILGYAQAINAGVFGEPQSPKYCESVDNIHFAGTHLLQVLNNLIVHASNGTSSARETTERRLLSDLIVNAVEMVEIFATSANHKISVELVSDLVHTDCQPALLQQALINLLSNAIKYTAPGGRIKVSMLVSGNFCEVRIADNGIGMSKNDIALAMKQFGRVDLPAHIAREGSGIGLSIVQEIVENHQGDFKLQSRKGEGTTATIRLPIAAIQ